MAWQIRFHDAVEMEFEAMAAEVQDELTATAKLLQDYGPKLGRPHADTLNGSQFSNMKELRLRAADGVWRVAFAFDPTARVFCSWPVTNRVAVKESSTSVLSLKPMNAMQDIWRP